MERGRYCIWLLTHPDFTHPCFDEVAMSLRDAFAALGYEAPIVRGRDPLPGRPVILGACWASRLAFPPDKPPIIFNMEQIDDAPSHYMTENYLNILRSNPTWDYSPLNIRNLEKIGVKATHCGVGYMPSLSCIPPAPAKDIDVLFIGVFHERRHVILEALHNAGVNVVAIGGRCFGAERDALYARAKIVINLHKHEAQVFEIVRVSYLLANRVCVVSETGKDLELEGPLRGGVAFADYDALVATCVDLLQNDAERLRIAEEGYRLFSQMSQVDMLRSALAATR